jgi:hypothetical protein
LKSPKVNESLRTALAGVNAKLSELRTENKVLQDASSRAKELALEKATIVKQHAALQKVFSSSRSLDSFELLLTKVGATGLPTSSC